MKKIQLTKGEFALVDDDDFDYLNQWNWVHWDKSRNKWKVQLARNDKTIFIGRFDNLEDAIRARENVEKSSSK